MTQELEEQIRLVASARINKGIVTDKKVKSFTEWEDLNSGLLAELSDVSLFLSEEEARLRELTIEAYNQTGEKKPAEGVGIRVLTKLKYDQAEAYEWALVHKLALKLDMASFENHAKASPLDFVEPYDEVTAIIATNLT